MAVEVSRSPAAFPCGKCDCVEGVSPEPRWAIPNLVPITRHCLKQQIEPRSTLLLSMFPHWQKGVMYRDGGLSKQPHVFTEAMTAIQGYLNEDAKTS